MSVLFSSEIIFVVRAVGVLGRGTWILDEVSRVPIAPPEPFMQRKRQVVRQLAGGLSSPLCTGQTFTTRDAWRILTVPGFGCLSADGRVDFARVLEGAYGFLHLRFQ